MSSVYLFACGRCPATGQIGNNLKEMTIDSTKEINPTTGKASSCYTVTVADKHHELRDGYFSCSSEGRIEKLSYEAGAKLFGEQHVCPKIEMVSPFQLDLTERTEQVTSEIRSTSIKTSPALPMPSRFQLDLTERTEQVTSEIRSTSIKTSPALPQDIPTQTSGALSTFSVGPYTRISLPPGSEVLK